MLITLEILAKTIRSFNASDEVNDLINESGIKKGEMSTWINDKIKKGILYDVTEKPRNTIPGMKMVEKVRLRY